MDQIEYLKQLKRHLSPLERDERNKIIEYYSELISDKLESGITEQEVLKQFGEPKELAAKILSESHDHEKHTEHSDGKLSVGRIIGFSILIPFVIIALAVLYVLAVSFALAAVGCQLGGVFYFLGSFFVLAKDLAVGLFNLGASLFAMALGVFIAFGAWKFIRLCIKITISICKAYKQTYVKEAVRI